jgi:hypothetical protein
MLSIATVVRKRVCRQAAHVGSSQPVPGRTNRSGEGDAERNRDLKRNQLNSRGFWSNNRANAEAVLEIRRGVFRVWACLVASLRPPRSCCGRGIVRHTHSTVAWRELVWLRTKHAHMCLTSSARFSMRPITKLDPSPPPPPPLPPPPPAPAAPSSISAALSRSRVALRECYR